ncbi:hypothetical protein C4D60_Mb09t09490 [Musa balbisiana]|uniref:Bacterial surface antigen (D15) domain-containing protein n=1 Tax=Musa balbisiana TaxID=52838 RepID=A0A4S8IFA3_MUSBA|nr:hypothetical protein C4D60_Mb09t09490 [Musa balbisiana]
MLMGAQKSIHAGKAKIDFNVDLTQKLCGALLLPHIRQSTDPFSQVIARLSIKHPNLFGRNEKLEVLWNKGLDDSNILIAFRRPRPDWTSQQSFTIQYSVTPETAVHGLPVDHFSHSGSGSVNLCRFSAGVDFNEPSTSHWSSTTGIKFEHVHPINNDGHMISRDVDGFPITSSGSAYDNMVILKQEAQCAIASDDSFTRLNFQMEQGLPLLSKWLIFNRFKFVASKGFKLGPTFLVTSTLMVSLDECSGNPALRQGKPGFGVGVGYGIRFSSHLGQLRVDYAMNAFRQKTVYFSINSVSS